MISVTNLSLAVLLLMQISSSYCFHDQFTLEYLQTDKGLCTLISNAVETSKNAENVEDIYQIVSRYIANNVEGGEAMKKMNFGSFKAKVKQFEAAVANALHHKLGQKSEKCEGRVQYFLNIVYNTDGEKKVDNKAPKGLLEFMKELTANEVFNTIGENLLAKMIEGKEEEIAPQYRTMLFANEATERTGACISYMSHTDQVSKKYFTDDVVKSIVQSIG